MGVCDSNFTCAPCSEETNSSSQMSHKYDRIHRDNKNRYNDKNMFDWTEKDVYHWILSLEKSSNNKLAPIADQFKKKKINGLMLRGIDQQYLQQRMNNISQENISLILSSRDKLLNPTVDSDNDTEAIEPSPKPITTDKQILQPPIKSSAQNGTSLDIHLTSLTGDNSALSDNENVENIESIDKVENVHEASSNKPGLSIIRDEAIQFHTHALDRQFLAELVSYGLSGIFTKSISVYDQNARELKMQRGEPPKPSKSDPVDDEEKTSYQIRPGPNKQLTQAKLIEVKSKSQLNAQAAEYIPSNPNAHSIIFSVVPMPKMTKSLSAPNPGLATRLSKAGLIRLNHVNNQNLNPIEEDSPTSPHDMNYNDANHSQWKGNQNKKDVGFIGRCRAKGNFAISRKLTQKNGIIDQRIQERIDNIFEYIDLSTVIQHEYEYNDGDNGCVRILDYDFHDKKTGEKLYCIVRKHDKQNQNQKKSKNREEVFWKMEEKLYTVKEIESMNQFYEIPKSTRESANQFKVMRQHKDVIERELQVTNAMAKSKQGIIKATKWHKKSIKITENKITNKIRRTLSMTKEEFQKRLIECIGEEEKRDVDLIPIVVFNDRGFEIEHVEIMNITEEVDVAISYKIDNNKNNIQCSAIYVDKNELIKYHHLVSPQHIATCKCFDRFKTNIDVLYIGNPDDKKNQIKALEGRLKKAKIKIDELENELSKYNKSPTDPGMLSGDNSPGSNSDKPQMR